MKEIERIGQSQQAQKSTIAQAKEQKEPKKAQESEDSIVPNTQPELDGIENAEAFLKEVASKLDRKALDAQTERFDEERIKALLSDD